MRNKRVSILAIAALMCGAASAQLVMNTSQTPQELVQDVLLGSGVTVSNVAFNGVLNPGTAQEGTGSFTGTSNLGISAGITLSTGLAQNIAQPSTGFMSDQLIPNYTDVDLQAVAGGITINNSAVLEFDFVTVGDSVKFRFVFGSEEYPEFVCSFNDAFGFFLSGPGITGPYTGNAMNIALVPGTGTPVTIDNVNNGLNNNGNPNDPNCPPVNPDFFVVNSDNTVVFDGFTVVIEAKHAVQCGQTYHIKLAICDALDQAYDSGVFLEAGSFQSSPFIPTLTPGPGIYGNTISESCFPMSVDFIRVGDVTEADTVQVVYGGSVTMGVDLVPAFPIEVIFPAGVDTIPFSFNAPIDGDGPEDIIITVSTFSECTGDTITNTFVFIVDAPPPLVLTSPPYSVNCGGSIEIASVPSGGYGLYQYDWGGGVTDSSIVVTPLVDTNYPITVTDTCGVVTTYEVPVTVIDVPNPFTADLTQGPTVVGILVQESCYEVNLNITRNDGTGLEEIAYLTFAGIATPGVDYTMPPASVIFPVGVATVSIPLTFPQDPDGSEQVVVTMGYISPCSGDTTEAVFVFTINQAPTLAAIGGDVSIPCEGSTDLTVVYTGGYAPYDLLWSGGGATTQTITVGPLQPTTYTATVTDDCGNISVATFNVDLLAPNPIVLSIIGANTVTEGCSETQINLIRPLGVQGALAVNVNYTGTAQNGADYNWPTTLTIPEDLLNVITPFTPIEDNVPDGSETAVITVSFTDACGRTVTASVTVNVEDAPPIVLTTEDIFTECQPDTVPIMVLATGGYGSLDLVWSNGDVGSVTYVTIQTSGVYTVTATDDCGRTATDQVNVDIDCDVVIPNVITPNGDGDNDVFEIEGIKYVNNTVRVFNRWGQMVFEASNYKNTWKADGVPDGTYFYEVTVKKRDEPYTGSLTILRNGW
ncbi:MAG: choice-of-anchor L domain-containing protein [Flavobacteriales bacterium]